MNKPEFQSPSGIDRDRRTLKVLNFITPDVLGVRALPEDPDELEQLRVRIDTKIVIGFGQSTSFSSAERAILSRGDDFSPALYEKFDSYLLEIAQEYGSRLFLSNMVMQRLWSWQSDDKDGVRKLRVLFHEIVHSAKIERNRAKGKINGRYKSAKPLFVREITALQMRLREAFPGTPAAVKQFVDDTIETSPEEFPMLKSNKDSLLRFLNDSRASAFRGSEDSSFKQIKGDLTPTRFFEQWLAAATNRDTEAVRQALSRA
jgi:hypothetical protein